MQDSLHPAILVHQISRKKENGASEKVGPYPVVDSKGPIDFPQWPVIDTSRLTDRFSGRQDYKFEDGLFNLRFIKRPIVELNALSKRFLFVQQVR